jgi:adenosylcobinamide-phosphate synthase
MEALMESDLLRGALIVIAALWLDRGLGEPRRFHPLVGFGNLVKKVEKWLRRLRFLSVRLQGILAWGLAVLPLVVLTFLLHHFLAQLSLPLSAVADVFILYLSIGGKSLIEHAHNIYLPLQAGDLDKARDQVALIVSRNTEKMSEKEITSAAVESVLENGNDAVFAPLFWFVVFGAPGAVLFRLANTLDAMWGYKNDRYLHFGYAAAKADDLLAWLPARLCAITYALQGQFASALHCWRTQAKACSSPNGGVVMTAGAGALGVIIGGPTYYHGVLHDKKPMGTGEVADWRTIPRANRLVSRGSLALSYLWLIFVCLGVVINGG